LELDLDFAEEGLEVISREEVGRRLESVDTRVRGLASTFAEGRLYRDGVSVVFAGRPNAGKSSLFNALLKEERAIVTEIPGTTRDFLEESVTLDGIPFRLVDTAGIHDSPDAVERMGIDRARTAMRAADIIVLVIDATERVAPQDVAKELEIRSDGQKVVVAANKVDLLVGGKPLRIEVEETIEAMPVVAVSALTGAGMHDLHSALVALASSGVVQGEHDVIITNRRHRRALSDAAAALNRARASLDRGVTDEFIALDLREAVNTLAEITGEVTSEEILNAIFSRFCIGK